MEGGSGEGAWPLRWSWALLRPGWVAPSPQQHITTPPWQSSPFPSFHPSSILPWCRSPLPASCILPAEMQDLARRLPAKPCTGPNACGIPMPVTSPGHGSPRQGRASSSALMPAGHSCLGTQGLMRCKPGTGLTCKTSASPSVPSLIPTSWKFYSQLLS